MYTDFQDYLEKLFIAFMRLENSNYTMERDLSKSMKTVCFARGEKNLFIRYKIN
jgi:hypothetical protein